MQKRLHSCDCFSQYFFISLLIGFAICYICKISTLAKQVCSESILSTALSISTKKCTLRCDAKLYVCLIFIPAAVAVAALWQHATAIVLFCHIKYIIYTAQYTSYRRYMTLLHIVVILQFPTGAEYYINCSQCIQRDNSSQIDDDLYLLKEHPHIEHGI